MNFMSIPKTKYLITKASEEAQYNSHNVMGSFTNEVYARPPSSIN